MNVTFLFWLGFSLNIIGSLIWSGLFKFSRSRAEEILGKNLVITGGVLASMALIANAFAWLVLN